MEKFLLTLVSPVLENVLKELLSPDNIQAHGDKLFDFIEDAVESSKTTIDDVTVLPIIKAMREGLNIPDND